MKPVAPIETVLESAAALWTGACAGTALWLLSPAAGNGSALLALAGGAVAAAATLRLLHGSRDNDFALPTFDVPAVESSEFDELLLTEEVVERVSAPVEELMLTLEQGLGAQRGIEVPANDELLLEDVLPRVESESRVIRLFDPAAMPTAGELRSRIDRHLQNREAPAYPDAAQALNDALADLRRSLR